MKKCPSFENEIIYRFIIDFFADLSRPSHFQMIPLPLFRYDKWQGSVSEWSSFRIACSFRNEGECPSFRKPYRFIAEGLADLSEKSFRNESRTVIFKWGEWPSFWKAFRFILVYFLDLRRIFSEWQGLLFNMIEGALFGMIRGSLRYDLSSLWLPAPSFRKRGDLLLIITEEISYFYHLKGRIFRLKINAVKWCKTAAWIFWKSGHFRREKSLQKSFRNLLISIGKSFLRLLIESHKTGQIIGELRFFRAEPRFLPSVCPVYLPLTPVFQRISLS